MKKILLSFAALCLAATSFGQNVVREFPVETYENLYNKNYYGYQGSTYAAGAGQVKTTLQVLDDDTYVLKNWFGVDGYDLEFAVNGDGAVIVLNEDAVEKTPKSGNTYWKINTGLENYPQACVYSNKDYSPVKVSNTVADINFYSCYIYDKDGNGTVYDYSTRGYLPTWTKEAAVSEYGYDANDKWTTITNVVKEGTTSVRLHYFEDTKSYTIQDWLGDNTGDLSFTVNEDKTITLTSLLSGYLYNNCCYYFKNNTDDIYMSTAAYDYNNVTYYPTVFDAQAGTFEYNMYYYPDFNASNYVYSDYYLEWEGTGVNGVKANSSKSSTSKYLKNSRIVIEKNGKKFSTTGVEVK